MNFEKNSDAEALLQFQDFGTANIPLEAESKPPPYEQTHNFSSFPSAHVDIDDEEASPLDPSSEAQKNVPSMLSWAYYQRFFDVDTSQVKERLVWSFLPRPSRDTLTHYIRPTPDLYGPFWVCATLVFCIAIMGNVADYLQSGGEGRHWRYDFRKVSISATTIFCYALLVPLVLWSFLWWRHKQDGKVVLRLLEMVSLYGYSLAIYIPISVLWTIPLPGLQWALVFVGAALSGSVLVLAFWPPLSSIQKGVAVAMLGIIVALHFLLAAGLQLYFFSYSHAAAVAIPSGTGNGADSPAHLKSVEEIGHPLGRGVTELHPVPLNLVLEENHQPAIVKALESPSSSSSSNSSSTGKTDQTKAIGNQTVSTSTENQTRPSSAQAVSDLDKMKKDPAPVPDNPNPEKKEEVAANSSGATSTGSSLNVTSTKKASEKPT